MDRRENKLASLIRLITILCLMPLASFMGMDWVKHEITYMILQNIAVFSYAILGIVAIIFLHERFWAVTSGFMIANAILGIGKLYFLPYRLYHALLLVLFGLSLVYLIVCLIWGWKDKPCYRSFHVINGVIPVTYIGIASFVNFCQLEIETEMDIPAALIGVGLAIAIMVTIFVGVLGKNRLNKKDYVWATVGGFFVAMLLAVAIPVMSLSHINYAFDTTPGEQVVCSVVQKVEEHSSGKYQNWVYYLLLDVNGEKIRFQVDKITFENQQEGETICLYAHEGALHYPYLEYKMDFIYKYREE